MRRAFVGLVILASLSVMLLAGAVPSLLFPVLAVRAGV